jgi:uncharacterized membrane protein YgdD (TMEM256/DUF423 family)
MTQTRLLPFIAALNGLLAVALGALGAHALEPRLEARDMVGAWQTAAHYHLAHAVASLALLAWATAQPARAPTLLRAVLCWQVGCLLFAGSIYILALGGPRAFGPITPLGGLAFIAGWGLLALESLRGPRSS